MAILQYEYKGFEVVIMAVTSTPDVNISSRNPRLREKLGEPFITFKAPNIEMARAMAEERIDALRMRRKGRSVTASRLSSTEQSGRHRRKLR